MREGFDERRQRLIEAVALAVLPAIIKRRHIHDTLEVDLVTAFSYGRWFAEHAAKLEKEEREKYEIRR